MGSNKVDDRSVVRPTRKLDHVQRYLTAIGVVMALLVIGLGAYTRLVDAGLGCPDWPMCYGYLTMPGDDSEILQANTLFPEMPFDRDKAIPEVVHRMAAGLLGLVILVIMVLSFFQYRRRVNQDRWPMLPIAMFALVVLQGAFGAWTVTLKLWPQVVTLHLLGGFATAALLWLYLCRQVELPLTGVSGRTIRTVGLVFLMLLVVQITLGGWTSSNYAALACTDFPLCQGKLIPPMDWLEGFNVFQEIGPNYLGGDMSSEARIAIHFAHRVGALLVFCAGIYFAYLLSGVLRYSLVVALVLQIVLGILNVVFDLPLAIAVAHNLGAALLLLVTFTTLFFRPRTRSSVG